MMPVTNHLDFLIELCETASVPFQESEIRSRIESKITGWGIPHFRDAAGNLVVGPASSVEYQRWKKTNSRLPLKISVAHMDHPGMSGLEWKVGINHTHELEVEWLGGGPVENTVGHEVRLFHGDARTFELFRVASIQKSETGRTLKTLTLTPLEEVLPEEWLKNPKCLFGTFIWGDAWTEIVDGTLYTKSADDLAGVFSILMTAKTLNEEGILAQGNWVGLLTRAEEVGFVGCVAHLEAEYLEKPADRPRPIYGISLEASKALDGAEIGKGVIVRLGDRSTLFDSNGTQAVLAIAEQILAGRFQRRIMDGGSCEASALYAFEIPSVALSVPLGNYHNQGEDGGPAPEVIHLDDLNGMVALHLEIARPTWPPSSGIWSKKRELISKNFDHWKDRLN